MTSTEFVYTTYIKSTPEKVWQAITTPEFTRQYWDQQLVSDWKTGSEWKMLRNNDQSVNVVGKVIESKPPNRLTLSWAEIDKPSDESHVIFEIETVEDFVRLNVIHSKLSPYMGGRVSQGWPRVLASLKSILETGESLTGNMSPCGSNAA